MATIGGVNNLTLLDIQKRLDRNDKIANIIEMLAQSNEMLQDMSWVEGDSADGLTATLRTGIPTPTWRRFNEGVQPTKSTSASVNFTCGMVENYSEVDVDLARRVADPMAVRLSEATPILEGINQEVQRALIYEDEKLNAGRITGLQAYYNSVLTATSASATNVIDAGGTGSNNTSIYIVCWHPQGVTGIYPKDSKAGLQHFDHGELTTFDANGVGGARLRVFQDRWQWKCGLAVKDWRQAVRICNINYTNLITDTGAADLVKLLFRGIQRINMPSMGRIGIYMNRAVITKLSEQSYTKIGTGGGLTFENVDGVLLTKWNGYPIRRVDQLAINEARVV